MKTLTFFISIVLCCNLNAQTNDIAQVNYQLTDSNFQSKKVNYSEEYKLFSSLAVREHVSKNLTYPKRMEDNGIEGRLVIKLRISETGEILNITIPRSSHTDFTESVLNLFRDNPINKLEPNSRKYIIHVPIHFKLS